MRILKNFRYFYSFVLASLVRANFNHKSEKFKKLYNFNLAIFFNDTLSNEIQINGVYEKEELNLISKIFFNVLF